MVSTAHATRGQVSYTSVFDDTALNSVRPGWSTGRLEAEVRKRFLDVGDLHKAFARVYCDQCGHDYLLAYSCKTRYFCPSCHQKRILAYGEWLENNVLAPVPHRQYVFALPKLIRPFFRHRRRYLGELCRLVAALLKAGLKPGKCRAKNRSRLLHSRLLCRAPRYPGVDVAPTRPTRRRRFLPA